MSEVIVRMEMPHDGLCDLALSFLGGTFCAIEGNRCNYCDDGVIPKWCPIICALPENHGRLVDVNIVEKKIKDAEELSELCDEFEFGGRWIVDLSKIPTIVPATETEATPCP